MKDKILKMITNFYVNSEDFNGIPIYKIIEEFEVSLDELKKILIELVKNEKITLTFGSISVNPHIKRFSDLDVNEQINQLNEDHTNSICAYPTKSIIKNNAKMKKYKKMPFTKRLFLGEAQLLPLYFDPIVLERYLNDPRYFFDFYDYGCSIFIQDEYFDSKSLPSRDNVFIQSIGLGHDSKKKIVFW